MVSKIYIKMEVINEKINFSVPITEQVVSDCGDFKIKGTAINVTTTRNGTIFTQEELIKSAHTLQNKPILKDHNNSVDSIVGKTTENVFFEELKQAISFEGIIKDKKMQEKIQQGLITAVSIGAMVRNVEEVCDEESGEIQGYKVSGIEFVELSLVAVPADPGAGFAKAILAKLDFNQKQTKEKTDLDQPEGEDHMAEEIKEEKITLESLKLKREALEQEVAQLEIQKLQKEKETIQQSLEEEPEKEAEVAPVKDETKGEVVEEEETSEAFNGYQIESDGKYAAISADYQAIEGLKNLKR